MGEKFTWFPKFTAALAKVPPEHRGDLAWAIILYGTDVVEPDVDWPFDAIFEGLREDIDNSRNARSRNGGGRPPKKAHGGESDSGCDDGKPPFPDEGTPVSDDGGGGSENAEPKPVQYSPVQASPIQAKPKRDGRFAPPSVGEVRDYCREKGYTFDPERFVAYYESNGWMVGKNRMKSWRASCTTWQKREQPEQEGGGGDAYSAL